MIDGAFSFVPGIGPSREKQLRHMGIVSWDLFPDTGTVLSPKLDSRVRDGIAHMRTLLSERRFVEAAQRLPNRELWRVYPHVADDVCFLDIETTFDGRITVVGVWDPQRGPRLWVRGHNLHEFVDAELPTTVVTFNGASFDLPVLQRSFPGWKPPPIHIDLCPVFRRLDERGGLKAIETRLGLARPDHLLGVGGDDAVRLWDGFTATRNRDQLRRLLEYNLYDVVQLRSLAEIACERLSALSGREWSPQQRFHRGEVLFDLTRCVEQVVMNADRIVPDAIEEWERRALVR